MDTYGINVDIASLEAAAEATANWPYNCGYHSAVYYDSADGKVWTRDEGDDKTMIWKSEAIRCVLRTTRHASPQRIMDCIKEAMEGESRCAE